MTTFEPWEPTESCRVRRGPQSIIYCERTPEHAGNHIGRGRLGQVYEWPQDPDEDRRRKPGPRTHPDLPKRRINAVVANGKMAAVFDALCALEGCRPHQLVHRIMLEYLLAAADDPLVQKEMAVLGAAKDQPSAPVLRLVPPIEETP